MKIQPKQTLAQNKLALLYLLSKSNIPLSELQLERIVSELALLNYFDLKECLFELAENNHIVQKTTPHGTQYSITQGGRQMLDVLMPDLRHSARRAVDEYLLENISELKKESQLIGEFIKLSGNEYRVILKVLENDRTIFEIQTLVYSKEQAQSMLKQWKDNAVALYKTMLSHLC